MMKKNPEREDELGRLYKASQEVPSTPAAEMWPAIEAKLPTTSAEAGPSTVVSLPVRRSWPAWKWAAAAGVVLAIGVGIGRTSVVLPTEDGGPLTPVAAVDPPPPAGEPSLRAFTAHTRGRIADLEPLLTMIAADAGGGRYDPQLGDWAKSQLNRTRLALDSPGASDPTVRHVLEDLELILMQVATLGDIGEARANQEMGLIAQALEEQGLLDRVRAMRVRGP
ncbi:MAG: hypothetical protein ACR2QM_01045 [Longimicrobiales bacterium]